MPHLLTQAGLFTGSVTLTQAVLLAGLVLTLLGSLTLFRRYLLAHRPRITAAETLEQGRQVRGLSRDLEQLMAEVEQVTRRFSEQIEARTSELQRLIAQADQRLAALRQMNHPTHADPDTAPPTAPNPSLDAQPDDPLAIQVYQLADRGLSSVDIARQLKEHVGKIELILALRRGQ